MHWTSAERTAPLNAPSLTESTKQSVKEEEEGEERGGLRASSSYCTTYSNWAGISLQPPVAVFLMLTAHFGKETKRWS